MLRYQAAGLWIALVGCLAGCVDVNGGAVEVRWEIRKTDGTKTDCTDARVARVRLVAAPVSGAPPLTRSWPCTDYQAATAFDLPPGRYALSIESVCRGEDAGVSMAVEHVPDPIIRDVTSGNVAELNTLLIEKVPGTGVICQTPP
jgi:hypothetical protein